MTTDTHPRGLTVYADLEQRSLEWYQARCGLVTASAVGALLTAAKLEPADNDTSRGLMNTLIAERITGHVEPTYVSHDMLRGQLDEPFARDMYAKESGREVQQVGFMVREFDGARIGYSPDGLVKSDVLGDGLIEIKSRSPKEQVAFTLSGNIPHAHMAQMQAGMLVSGRAWCDYVSYAGGLPMVTLFVARDVTYQAAIVRAVQEFEGRLLAAMNGYRAITRDCPVAERIDHFADVEV